MFKDMSIKKKFILISIIVTVIMVSLSFGILTYIKLLNKEEVLLKTKIELQQLAKTKLDSKMSIGITNAISIANDGRIKKALRTNNRDWAILSLNSLSKKMAVSTQFKKIKVHIHTKDNHAFVRSWKLKKFGDDLSGFRASVVNVNSSKKAVNGFEVGKAGLSLRAVAPVFDDENTHLGSLEFMQGVNSVAKSFDKSRTAFVLLMDRAVSSVKQFDANSMYKDKYVISQQFVNKEFMANADNLDLDKLFKDNFVLNETCFVTYIDIKDFQGKKLGIALLARPAEVVAHTVEDTENIIYISLALIIAVSFLTLLFNILNLNITVISPIKALQDGIDALIKFSSANQEIEIKSNDEIGEVAKIFNLYLSNIRDVTKQDQQVVEEAEKAIEMARAGFFVYTVKSTSSNRVTNDLRNSVNGMIKDLNNKFGELNKALIAYGNANFDYQFNIENVSGSIGSMVAGTKAIGSNVSELLATILISGEQLSHTIETLSSSAESLSTSSNEQAASLEETAAAVEQITSNIRSNSENIANMEVLDEIVMKSAIKGQGLAKETAVSMDEINTQVSAINEAIAIIDQIAFQTNILSLNAAVEAATAGEAGKGFAVVAGEVRNLASRSAEAANEIKDLVENAKTKADKGKNIADEMIKGYDELNANIVKTKEIIDSVAIASKEQEKGISQINDAIGVLDTNTQENAADATSISDLSKEVKLLSDDLLNISEHAKYQKEAREQVCDIDLVYKLNGLKLDHISFKETNFEKLSQETKFRVTTDTECKLGQWIAKSEQDGKDYTKTKNWGYLKEEHHKVHKCIQTYIDHNADQDTNAHLIEIGNNIEEATDGVFKALNMTKRDHCKSMNL